MEKNSEIKVYYSEEFRKEMLELSDDRILWNVRMNDDSDYESWDVLVKNEIRKFMTQFGVPVYVLGRTGRHVCVEDSKSNRDWYRRMRDYVNDAQKRMIAGWNDEHGR